MNRRLSKTDCYQEMLKDAPEEMQEVVASLDQPLIDDFEKDIHQWIRMLFSCLVDADYLDTERFMHPEQAARRGQYDSMETLKDRFDAYMESLTANAPASFINEKRAAILSRCRKMAESLPGFFSLTVPTGGGKTLASMAWALLHAVRYKKKRIIIVIPYTSIIVQTAAVLRDIFGAENVVEHHSNLQQDSNDERSPSLLATENWDEAYPGLREGYSGGYQLSGSSWTKNVTTGNVYDRLQQVLGLVYEDGRYLKYAGPDLEYRFYDLHMELENAPLAPSAPEGITQLNVTGTVTVEVPLSFGFGHLPPMQITMKLNAKYVPRF